MDTYRQIDFLTPVCFRFLHIKRSVTLIQAAVRGRQHMVRYNKQRAQCIKIQTYFRGFQARKLLVKIKAARTMQRHVRGLLTRTQMKRQAAAAVQIQVGPVLESQ